MDKWKVKTAAFPPMEDPQEPPGPGQRNIPKDHAFDPRALKPMAKALWATSVSLGHALTAYRQLSRVKSATVSPDGMLGGRGYVMEVTAMRGKLHDACEILSQISDTIFDEVRGPHWQPKLALLDDNEAEDVERFIEESRENLDDPTEDAEKEMTEIEKENDGPGGTSTEEPGSKLPTSDKYQSEAEPVSTEKQARRLRSPRGKTRVAMILDVKSWKVADATNNPDALGGPRVDHRGPAEGDGPFGSYNRDEPPVRDDWSESDGGGWNEYDYPSDWDNNLKEQPSPGHHGESALPNDPGTPTEGDSFGLGQGEGEALDYDGPGPESGLPTDYTSGPQRDITTPGVEYSYERITTPGMERPK